MDGRSMNRTPYFVVNESQIKQKPVFIGNTVRIYEIIKYL
jgi:hypothetical protein